MSVSNSPKSATGRFVSDDHSRRGPVFLIDYGAQLEIAAYAV